ncbi:two-component system sensor kinase [Thermotomaculum hydrothermale]|uniref:histidine kinase n=1 Tax=Thermotomaculum hydrothermale TaxID=981385 RepID=A0A7R6PUZ6_9BACT|nr:ATP-binding protein [Thermotomaculum hydrothermale]BBB33192.1 two-component system sensor kinase [Thermotomaculum hydrothermale]
MIGFYSLFLNPFVFSDLITFFKNPVFFQYFFILILSASFLFVLKPCKFLLILVLFSLFFSSYVFVFSLILFLISIIRGEKISILLLKLLLFSIFLSFLGHFYSFQTVKEFVKKNDFSYSYLREQGKTKLEKYLVIAKTRGFANLKDFVQRSGLKNEDYYVAYINILGEVVESYSNNLPSTMDISEKFSSEVVDLGGKPRFVLEGYGRFKVGKILISISNDVYSHPFVKKHPEILKLITVEKGDKGFVVSCKKIDYFYAVTDLAIIFLIGITSFLIFSSSQKRVRLFERVIFSIYLGFSIIFIVLGLFLFVFSNRIAFKVVETNAENNLKKIQKLIESEPNKISDEYLTWLKEVFKVDVGIYGNGVLQITTNRANLSLLMPFKVFNSIKFGEKEIYFVNGIAFKALDFKEIPFAVLGVAGGKDFNPLYEFLRIISLIFFVIFVVSYFVSYEITKSFVMPLVELSHSAKAVVKGDFEVDIDYNNDDEIKELIDSISFMAKSLKENYDRLKTIIDNVSSAIVLTDNKGKIVLENKTFELLERELKEKALKGKDYFELDYNNKHYVVYKKEVEEGLKMVVIEDLTDVVKASKLEIISDIARKVAHDIKNPLTPIKLNIEYLLAVFKKRERDFEEVLPKVAENVLQKVEELKNISSQFSGIFKASRDENFESINIKEFLETLFASYPGVKFEIKGKDFNIKASKLKLSRVFENLIENTISFSEKPYVEIDIRGNGEFVKIDYRDNSSGIKNENIEKIFEPYFSTREDGTGLGLFIVKEFVEEMGGGIKAYSSEKGGHFELKFRKTAS